MLDDLYHSYPDILRCHSALKLTNYQASLCYLVPRIKRGKATIGKNEKDGYFIIGTETTAPMVIPYNIDSTKEYLMVLLDVIHKANGVSNIPKPYALALEKLGYKTIMRPWGNRDFVFNTEYLATLPGGRHSRKRTYISRLYRSGVELVDLTPEHHDKYDALERYWGAEHEGRTGRRGYATEAIDCMGEMPECIRFTAIGAFIASNLIGFVVGAKLNEDHWSCSFRYADNDFKGLSTLLFQAIAQRFIDVPYECDGDGGGQNSSLWEYKRRLLSEDVLTKQVEMYIAKKKK